MKRTCCRLDVRVHPGAERWAISPATAQRLACMLSRDLTVEYVPRSALASIWERDHGGTPLPTKPYAFRAYSRDGNAVLFVDDTETPTSTLWLLLHELAHLELPRARLLHQAYRNMKRPAGYLTSDEGHEAHPEEQMANLIANQTLPKLVSNPGQYDRLWWRNRVRSMT